MGNSESPISEIQLIIEQMQKDIPFGRFFEFGVDSKIVQQVENHLTKIVTLLPKLNKYYASKSLAEINRYSDAATLVATLQKFVKEVQDRGGGSKVYTSRIRSLLLELDSSFNRLQREDSPAESTSESLPNKLTELASGPSAAAESVAGPSAGIVLTANELVVISYAKGHEHEKIVDQIDESLQKRGLKIIRDKRDLGYKGSIRTFMERSGRGFCVIVVISDEYLRSSNCMFELIEIAANRQFHDRIFPIVLADADIYDPIKRIKYVKYWEQQRKALAKAMLTVDPANLKGIRDDMDLYDRIRDEISELTSVLKDMNTFAPDRHRNSDFTHIYKAIEKRLKERPS